MDVEKCINLVFGHKCLWDQSDSRYHLRDYQRRAWKEVSEELGICVDELKKKWRGLRDTFGKELKKVSCKRSGQAADTELNSKWPYFNLLLFLRDTMSRRDLKSSVPDTSETSDGNSSFDGDDTSIGCNYPPAPSPGQSSVESPIFQSSSQPKIFKSPLKRRPKRKQPDDIDTRMLNIEERKLKCLQESANDPEAQFLMSLLPYLKDIPKNRQLMVRTKLLQVLIDEQNASPELSYSSDQYSVINFSGSQNISPQSQQSVSQSVIIPQNFSEGEVSEYVMQFNPNN